MRYLFKEEKRERGREKAEKKVFLEKQSTSTLPYDQGPETSQQVSQRQDDALSVSVASSIEPYRSPLSSLAPSSLAGSIRPSTKSNRSHHHSPSLHLTGMANQQSEQFTFDISEEILKQCEMDTQFYDDYNPNINSGLTDNRVIKYFDKGALHSEPRKVLFTKYKPPANLSVLDTPKINPGISNLPSLHSYAKNNEAKLYDVHQNLTRATMAVVNIAETALNDERNSQVVDTTVLVKNCLEAIALLGHTSREVSNRRKMNLKPCLNPQTQELCSSSRPTTKYLLGDDVNKSAKEAKEVALLAKRHTYTSSKPSSYSSSTYTKKQFTKPRYTPYNSGQQDKQKQNDKPFLGRGRKAYQNYKKK